jgi:asparagine synthase (glutamine-hydrolysing)
LEELALCGLFGWALSATHGQDLDLLKRLTNLLAHRGPDGAGYWLGDTANGDYQIGLGHRRLSIIDISGGHQPMKSSNGLALLVFNGEIYNYIELREELRAAGHIFITQSDTEVLIEAYRAWGTDAILRFRGEFAFALWDNANQNLVFARDQFGKKPLFLVEMPGGCLFASEIEPLLQFPGISRDIDREALGQYLLNRYVPGPLTFFGSVKKLQPGCFGIWQEGALKIQRYFVPPIFSTKPDISCFDEGVSLFSKTFDEAVRIRMRSDAPFGAFLSGGLDSSSVVATMVRHSSQPVRTYSVGFEEKAYSELDIARAVSTHFNTDHHELVVKPREFLDQLPLATLRRGAPVSEPSDIPILLLSQMASQTVKMVLTGEGADEVFGGYPKHRAEMWLNLYQRLVPEFVHRHLVAPAVYALPYGMSRIKVLTSALGERDEMARMRIWFGGMTSAERDEIFGGQAKLQPPDSFPFSIDDSSSLRRTLFFDQTSWLPDNLLERGDRMMMAGSIEGRMPFMDTELAKVAARLPDSFLLDSCHGKLIVRAAMRSVLPPEILTRRKVGFKVPIDKWVRGPYLDFARDMLTSEASQIARLFRRDTISKLLGEHVDGRRNKERVLWALISLELFLRTFKPT